MSEQTIEIEPVENLREIDAQSMVALMQPDSVDYIVFKGSRTPIKKPNGFQIFNLINRFPSAQAIMINMIDRIKSAMLSYKGDVEQITDAEIMGILKDIAAEIKSENLYDLFIKVGDDAAAGFASICLGHPGNPTLEAAIKTASNEGLFELFKSCLQATFGGQDVGAFFIKTLIDFDQLGGKRKAEAAKEKLKSQKRSPKSANRTATIRRPKAA